MQPKLEPKILLVPYKNVHNGTSKHHKTYEKEPIFCCTFLHQYLDF